mmetsp:Transcript_86446/g.153080  ORF Transcript_86446/g.153080 Transcript_86446/m.153080 type:complete len:128 (-) Transcript_86446:14-397(-)
MQAQRLFCTGLHKGLKQPDTQMQANTCSIEASSCIIGSNVVSPEYNLDWAAFTFSPSNLIFLLFRFRCCISEAVFEMRAKAVCRDSHPSKPWRDITRCFHTNLQTASFWHQQHASHWPDIMNRKNGK